MSNLSSFSLENLTALETKLTERLAFEFTLEEQHRILERIEEIREERHIRRFPLRTEVCDGRIVPIVPEELSHRRFNTDDMARYVRRALAFVHTMKEEAHARCE